MAYLCFATSSWSHDSVAMIWMSFQQEWALEYARDHDRWEISTCAGHLPRGWNITIVAGREDIAVGIADLERLVADPERLGFIVGVARGR